MVPTNYSNCTRGSLWKTAFLTTVFTLLLQLFSYAQTTECTADAGTLSGEICIQNQAITVKATLRGDTVVPAGYRLLYVLTSGDNLVIEEVSEEASFDIDELEGVYTIHTLVYDTATLNLDSLVTIGETTGTDLNELLIQGGGTICAALDVAGARFRFNNCTTDEDCDADAGRLTSEDDACLGDSTATLTAAIADSATVPNGYSLLYVLTSGDSLVIEQVNDEPTFTVDTTGRFTIHTLVYDSTTLNLDSIVIGETTGGDVNALLIQGGGEICGALDVQGAVFTVEACDDDDCDADAGRLTATEGACLGDSTATLTATIADSATVPTGYSLLYVLTSGDSLVIEQVNDEPTFTVDTTGRFTIHTLVYDSTTLNLDSIEIGITTGGDVNELLTQGGGEICGALDVTGARFDVAVCPAPECEAETGRLTGSPISCLEEGDSLTLRATVQTAATVPNGYQVLYVLTSGDSLVIEQVNNEPEFDVDSIGTYRIHVLVYDSTTLDLDIIEFGETTGGDVNALLVQGGGDICGALDVRGVRFNVINCPDVQDSCIVTAGSLIVLNDDACLESDTAQVTIEASVQEVPIVLDSFQIAYVLTSGDSLVILDVNDEPSFTVDSAGRYRIHTLVYDSTTLSLDSIVLGTTTGFAVNGLLIQGGGDICGALDTEGALFDIQVCQDSCEATFGELEADDDDDACLDDSTATLTARVVTPPNVPAGYSVLYVLTSGNNLVIEQVNDEPTFTVDTTGRYTIHTLVYDSTTLNLDSIVIGETTGAEVNALLIQGGGEICGALDVEGVVFNVEACGSDSCDFDLGRIQKDNDSDDCVENGEATIRATVEEEPEVPNGYTVAYVLTYGLGNDRVIQQINDEPVFTVDTSGRYRILTFVYDSTTFALDSIDLGETTSDELNELLIQGGGEICAGLDLPGLTYNIRDCRDTTCNIELGELEQDDDSDECLEDGEATIRATVEEEPEFPDGFSVAYLLAYGLGNDRVIQQINEEPTFTVDTTGRYRILTLVYNPETFDLDSIALGETASSDLDELLGDDCAEFDENGLIFNIDEDCDTTGVECDTLELGELMIVGNDVRCFENDTIDVELRFTDAPELSSRYEIAYVITQGDDNTVTQLRGEPSFSVDSVGLYRIHVLVYDPATFDLNSINIGTTTAGDINETLVQGGGDICAALDTNGIVLDVRNCDDDIDCEDDVDAGSLFAPIDGACLDSTYQAVLTAEIAEAPMVPAGYEVAYVLTFGSNLVIEAVNDEPTFTVNQVGQYRIHALVYNPATLDLEELQLGTTRASEVNDLLIQGGGDICAALDLEGARFDTRDCSCGAYAGELNYTRPGGFICLRANSVSFLTANTKIRPVTPPGYQRLYVLTSGNNLVIEKVANIPVFGINETGTYRIHTLIYDPTTLDLNSIEFGVTTAAEINALLRQGGGDICAALELPGLKYTVNNCVDRDDDDGDEDDLVAYPNPATNQLNITLPQNDQVQRISIELIDMNGNISKRWQMDGQSGNANLDIQDIQPGMYHIRVLYDQEFVKEMSIVKVR
ncbi:MAG: T9SS type A sorting domain-containing protein [Saprospiraceae bacterium]